MLNKYSTIPLYCQLKNLIIEKIDSGDYKEDSKIPSEQEFCELYGISRPTVRQAILELTNNGYLYKEKGKGTFVAKSKTTIDVKRYSGFTDSILDGQVPEDRDIVSIQEINGNDNLNEIFNLPVGQALYSLMTFCTRHQEDIIALNMSYIPLSLFPNMIEDIQVKKTSSDILIGKYPLVPVKTKSSMEITYTEQCEAHYLQVQPGQALIKIENILYSKNGQAVEYVVSKYRSDKCRLVFENMKT